MYIVTTFFTLTLTRNSKNFHYCFKLANDRGVAMSFAYIKYKRVLLLRLRDHCKLLNYRT
ncbi:MAG: hypothetical protein ACI8RD_007152 [Bacillariaceae sp.]|jgi:hypothetical protein